MNQNRGYKKKLRNLLQNIMSRKAKERQEERVQRRITLCIFFSTVWI